MYVYMYCNLEVWRTKHPVQLNILLLHFQMLPLKLYA